MNCSFFVFLCQVFSRCFVMSKRAGITSAFARPLKQLAGSSYPILAVSGVRMNEMTMYVQTLKDLKIWGEPWVLETEAFHVSS